MRISSYEEESSQDSEADGEERRDGWLPQLNVILVYEMVLKRALEDVFQKRRQLVDCKAHFVMWYLHELLHLAGDLDEKSVDLKAARALV